MSTLVVIEYRKLVSTPALYVMAAITVLLAVVGVVTNILLAGSTGMPALGTPANASKVLAIASVTGIAMLIMGILSVAGEYRHRTILGTYLAEPRKSRVLAAKLVVMGVTGALVGALAFGLTLAIALPLFATKGVHDLPIDIPRYWFGAAASTACLALLGVAIGCLVRNTVGAVIGALVWMQIVEQLLLAGLWPAVDKWLPIGAAVGLTTPASAGQDVLPPGVALLVLVGWTAALTLVGVAVSSRTELR